MVKKLHLHPDEAIILTIRQIRGQKVLLDKDLAALYGVETKVLNQAIKRNIDRFPEDFMFQLTEDEFSSSIIKSHVSDSNGEEGFLKSQFVTSYISLSEANNNVSKHIDEVE